MVQDRHPWAWEAKSPPQSTMVFLGTIEQILFWHSGFGIMDQLGCKHITKIITESKTAAYLKKFLITLIPFE